MPTYEDSGPVSVLGRGVRQTVLVIGICSVLLGVTVMMWPDKSVETIGTLVGVYLLSGAVLQLTIAFGSRLGRFPRLLMFVGGAVSAVLGVLAFRSGNWVLLVAMWLGVAWAVRGVVHAIAAVWDEDEAPGRGVQEAIGLCTLTVGIIVAIVPFDSVDILAATAGSCMIALGITEILTARKAPVEAPPQIEPAPAPPPPQRPASDTTIVMPPTSGHAIGH
ncbi:HdeD family acid-resistance protein [Nocardia sp. NPDC059180]|uniref:HdeD family acid-resistance protein n=1 Tax=Nocardia sp. NPDC059180 TaxID=3346761 RepID=UPI00367C306C